MFQVQTASHRLCELLSFLNTTQIRARVVVDRIREKASGYELRSRNPVKRFISAIKSSGEVEDLVNRPACQPVLRDLLYCRQASHHSAIKGRSLPANLQNPIDNCQVVLQYPYGHCWILTQQINV